MSCSRPLTPKVRRFGWFSLCRFSLAYVFLSLLRLTNLVSKGRGWVDVDQLHGFLMLQPVQCRMTRKELAEQLDSLGLCRINSQFTLTLTYSLIVEGCGTIWLTSDKCMM